MAKILVLQGVPASGKTTWAKEFVTGREDWVIISKDSIRESTGNYWVPSRENYISEKEVLSSRSKRAGGYIWKYSDDLSKVRPFGFSGKNITINGVEYYSISQASRLLNISPYKLRKKLYENK